MLSYSIFPKQNMQPFTKQFISQSNAKHMSIKKFTKIRQVLLLP